MAVSDRDEFKWPYLIFHEFWMLHSLLEGCSTPFKRRHLLVSNAACHGASAHTSAFMHAKVA